jgi:hypothetical protein
MSQLERRFGSYFGRGSALQERPVCRRCRSNGAGDQQEDIVVGFASAGLEADPAIRSGRIIVVHVPLVVQCTTAMAQVPETPGPLLKTLTPAERVVLRRRLQFCARVRGPPEGGLLLKG